jgi:hypothetical protein
MASQYIPAKDAEASLWMQTFANGISANPSTYQLQSTDATTISNTVNAFKNALTVSVDPATRTATTIAVKDDARATAEALCRQYAINIKFNAGISDANKIAIGVRPVNPNRSPVNVPASSPLLNVVGATPGSQTVRYADTSTPDSGKKPFGAVQLQLFVAVGTTPTNDETTAQLYGSFTKNPVGVGFSPDDDGKVATYFGRWVSRKGDVGPWSLPVSMRIAA